MRNKLGQFTNGRPPEFRYKAGTVKIRTRHKRNGQQRAFIKIEEPNKWILNCVYVWESNFGKIPVGYFIHHKDHNKLNDKIDNLALVTRAEHLEIHRPEFKDKAIAGFIAARRRLRWSTRRK